MARKNKIVNPQDFVGWKWEENKDKFNFVQWIYGNAIQEDLAFIWTMGVASEFFPGDIVARIYRKGEEVLDLRNYIKKPKILAPSKTNSDIVIDDSFISVNPNNEDFFQIHGELQDKGHDLRWDLEYERLVPQINAMDGESVGWSSGTGISSKLMRLLYKEWLCWQIKMPVAKIKGKVDIDGKIYEIDTKGYMDSNWGQWLIIDAHWNWMHTYGENGKGPYAIASVGIRGNPHRGDVYVRNLEEEVRFFKNKNEFEFSHLEWEKDKATKLQRPTVTELKGRNLEGYELNLLAKNVTPYALVQKFPYTPTWVAAWDMLESLVHVEGEVRNPKGERIIEVNSQGFKEYGQTGGLLGYMQRLISGKKIK